MHSWQRTTWPFWPNSRLFYVSISPLLEEHWRASNIFLPRVPTVFTPDQKYVMCKKMENTCRQFLLLFKLRATQSTSLASVVSQAKSFIRFWTRDLPLRVRACRSWRWTSRPLCTDDFWWWCGRLYALTRPAQDKSWRLRHLQFRILDYHPRQPWCSSCLTLQKIKNLLYKHNQILRKLPLENKVQMLSFSTKFHSLNEYAKRISTDWILTWNSKQKLNKEMVKSPTSKHTCVRVCVCTGKTENLPFLYVDAILQTTGCPQCSGRIWSFVPSKLLLPLNLWFRDPTIVVWFANAASMWHSYSWAFQATAKLTATCEGGSNIWIPKVTLPCDGPKSSLVLKVMTWWM